MEIVSFKVAKYLKEAGYPQGKTAKVYLLEDYGLFKKGLDVFNKLDNSYNKADIPTYLEAWIWLCDHISYIGERKLLSISIFKGRIIWELSFNCERLDSDNYYDCDYEFMGNTQEEVIKKAIEYLVDNDLIK